MCDDGTRPRPHLAVVTRDVEEHQSSAVTQFSDRVETFERQGRDHHSRILAFRHLVLQSVDGGVDESFDPLS